MSKPTDVPESTKLLPCLSCGGKASFFRSLPPGKGCFVECDTCDESTPVYPTEKPAIAAWNQRTPAASPVAPPESAGFGYRGHCNVCRGDWAFNNLVSRCPYCTGERVDIHCEPLASPVAGGSARIAEIAWDAVQERIAILTAHRCCHSAEHDPLNGRIHGYCIVCGVPWPCEYASQTSTEGWVKVTPETMPVVGEEILFVAHGDVEKGLFLGDKWVSDRSSPCSDEIAFTSEEVTGWRKLPAPPTAEEEREAL